MADEACSGRANPGGGDAELVQLLGHIAAALVPDWVRVHRQIDAITRLKAGLVDLPDCQIGWPPD